MDVTIQGLPEAIDKLTKVDNSLRDGLRRGLYQIAHLCKRTAVAYAPISPSTSMLKTLKKNGSITVRDRKKPGNSFSVSLTKFYSDRLPMLLSPDSRSITRPTPGGLMKSIQAASTDSQAEIFVPSNSMAGKYAFKIHEEKGKTWKERGPGTQAKGPQADDKFISRAITDNQRNIVQIINDQVNKAIGGP